MSLANINRERAKRRARHRISENKEKTPRGEQQPKRDHQQGGNYRLMMSLGTLGV